ncbi:hypothetical protein H0H81_007073 [Sphagnurus paluster]|uniref:FAD/NAD(P)-binding domain-containing protein n=1 Tax=Sphagnurus paluster TaxID=117069 RepID=A0A9P7GJP5_9AGAR|nr:hypothetical protein H0H81_007073 [Sphagnurus paluster]
MSTMVPDTPLPTLDRLNATVPDDLDLKQIARAWFDSFSQAATAGDAAAVAQLFVQDSFWRDMLAFTWDFRTFSGLPKISQFLADRLAVARPTDFVLRDDAFLGLQRPAPDLAWIHMMFDFNTEVGIASGIARLIPSANGEWRAHTVYTNLEDLKGFPEKIGRLRNPAPNHGKWVEDRKREVAFEGNTPTVLVVGGGQSGLDIAARLKALDVQCLVVEKNARIGDNWRNRYDALCLHDPVWYDHMPYLPFPSTWPVYTPAVKLANWLESYAEALELNVWTSSVVVGATQVGDAWQVTIKRGDGSERSFTVKHVIFATGLGANDGAVPVYPGMGVDVTMVQRSSSYIMSTEKGWKVLMEGVYSEGGPPTDVADRLSASFPHHMSVGLSQRTAKVIAELDKDILDGLRARGFLLNDGIQGTGFGLLAWSRAGGYYLDTGASQLIIDGKIKLKAGVQISRFTETGIKFEDGSELEADVVIFATGLGNSGKQIANIVGDEVAKHLKPVWGLDAEGEINGVWRDLGVKGLWSMMGV